MQPRNFRSSVQGALDLGLTGLAGYRSSVVKPDATSRSGDLMGAPHEQLVITAFLPVVRMLGVVAHADERLILVPLILIVSSG